MTNNIKEEEQDPEQVEPTPLSQNRRLLGAASLLAAANVIQRLLGLVREGTKLALFGATGTLDAFGLAAFLPQTLYQLIAGGEMVSSSLVPIFSEYAAEGKRDELWSAVSICLSIVTVIMVAFILIVEALAPWAARALGAATHENPAVFPLTIQLMRITAPAMLFLSLSSVVTAALNSLERFTLPAFTISLFNGAIIIAALLFPTSINSLAWGMLIGSMLMIVLQIPGLHDAKLKFRLEWNHPIIRRIMRLYAPILLGLSVNQFALTYGTRLATGLEEGSVTLMHTSTTLYQLPIGLVVVALSTVILPTLSRQANRPLKEFKETLAGGLKLVIALIFPAAAGLFALAPAVVALLFQRGEFTAMDSALTAQILRIDLIGLPFAGIDLILIYASYAMKDTLRPALVGAASVVFYIIAASILTANFGLPGLMAANAGKIIVHTFIMLILLQRTLDGLRGHGVSLLFFKALIASILTGLLSWGLWYYFDLRITGDNLVTRVLPVVVPGTIGLFFYLLMASLFGIQEVKQLVQLIPFLSRKS